MGGVGGGLGRVNEITAALVALVIMSKNPRVSSDAVITIDKPDRESRLTNTSEP
jgi:hypothetical protein